MEDGFQWKSFILYAVFFLSTAAVSEANDTGELDDYWRERKLMADAAAAATYKHDPLEEINRLNSAVHRFAHSVDRVVLICTSSIAKALVRFARTPLQIR
jgi:pectate lyase